MALIINTPIQLENGLIVENAYGRVFAGDNYDGKTITGLVYLFASKDAYDNGMQNIIVGGLNDQVVLAYNRTVDGSDILNIAHDALISKLAEQGITATKDLD